MSFCSEVIQQQFSACH